MMKVRLRIPTAEEVSKLHKWTRDVYRQFGMEKQSTRTEEYIEPALEEKLQELITEYLHALLTERVPFDEEGEDA